MEWRKWEVERLGRGMLGKEKDTVTGGTMRSPNRRLSFLAEKPLFPFKMFYLGNHNQTLLTSSSASPDTDMMDNIDTYRKTPI